MISVTFGGSANQSCHATKGHCEIHLDIAIDAADTQLHVQYEALDDKCNQLLWILHLHGNIF